MKKIFWVFIILLMVLFIPIIPHDQELDTGVTIVSYTSIFEIGKERYETVQKRVGVVSPEVPEMRGEDVVSEGKHVQ